jgi:hypothetical protein
MQNSNALKIHPTMTKTQKENWLTEKEAAAIIELPGTFFRKLVLSSPLKGVVKYLTNKRNTYTYNRIDIENYMFEDSFFARL